MLSASPRMSGFIYQVSMLNFKLQGVRCEKGNQIALVKFKSSASLNLSVVMQMPQAGNQGLVLPLVPLCCQLVKQHLVSVNAVKLGKKKPLAACCPACCSQEWELCVCVCVRSPDEL